MENDYMLDEPKSEINWRAVQTLQLGATGFIVFLMVGIWAATGFGQYFWPIWVWFGLSIPLAVQYAIRRALVCRRRDPDLHLGDDRLRLLALLAAVRDGRRADPARLPHRLVARAAPQARAGAERPRGRAHPHPPRRPGRPGGGAAPDRA